MDELDRMLKRLPEHAPPGGMQPRLLLAFHHRQRRRLFIQYSLSTALIVLGVVLVGPWALSHLAQIQLPQNGIPLLASTFATADTAPVLSRTWDGMSWIQTNLSQTTGLVEAAGLLLLAAGALIGMGPLLPRAGTDPALQTLNTSR